MTTPQQKIYMQFSVYMVSRAVSMKIGVLAFALSSAMPVPTALPRSQLIPLALVAPLSFDNLLSKESGAETGAKLDF